MDLDRLLGRHAEAEVLAWAKQLRHFYFMGELSSGQMDLYEMLHLRLDFDGSRDDLVRVLDALGVRRAATESESRVTNHPDLAQPGRCIVAGGKAWVYVEAGFVEVECATEYDVLEENVRDAVRIEALVDARGLQARVNRSIATHVNCISAATFPDAF